ncbi:aspartic peptidase domain-containing protein [Cercophora newfieldiana]|uniref:Aspartic peptidase domain-containing protein n=1 Tax=Cercophora newfieldiana TaxID=92897 RepID=A0AA40CTC1_9PEZI|nr:aspartic peptidase domain-containing protein [Cercophora newfieldiana]
MTRTMAPAMLIAVLSALIAGTDGLHIQGFPGGSVGPGFVSVPISASKRDAALHKRADVSGTAEIQIPNFRTHGYSIELMIGTPGQKVEVIVDTGSYELWVNPDCDHSSRAKNETIDGRPTATLDTPMTDPDACRKRGQYDASKSSSASKPDGVEDTVFQYADFTTAEISYEKDKLAIGGLSIDGQIFGVAKTSNQTGVGIMGFGPPPWGFNNSGMYPMVLTSMAREGVIKSPAFSLHLNDFNKSQGSVIFGGVDKKKFSGALAKIPMKPVQMKSSNGIDFDHTSYYVTVKSMKLSKPGSSDKTYGSFVAALDSGSSNNILPRGLGAQLCTDVGGKMNSRGTNCAVDCAVRQQAGGVTFELEGKSILVPYYNLINEETTREVSWCTVMVSDHPTLNLLGMPFLRSAYAVFDWRNANLHIAQSADCGTNIVAIGSGVDAVPGGNGECSGSLGMASVVNLGLMTVAALMSSLVLVL